MKPSTSLTSRCLTSMEKPSRLSKPICSPAMCARKALLKRIHRQELKKLQSVLPALSCRRRSTLDERAIIEEACRYIDQLHATVLARIQTGSLSPDVLQGLNLADFQRRQQMQFAVRPSNQHSSSIPSLTHVRSAQNQTVKKFY